MTDDQPGIKAARLAKVIRTYIESCNNADAKAVAACFCRDGVHYFPISNPPWPKWIGADAIGDNFAKLVGEQAVRWTVDQLITDVERCAGALEWTRFTRDSDRIVRGVDWLTFDPEPLLIKEVRTYRAAPVDPEIVRQEMQDFDYAGRGYPP
jgi:hypothetical protein